MRVSNCLDRVQDQHSVRPGLGLNILQRLLGQRQTHILILAHLSRMEFPNVFNWNSLFLF